MTETVLGLGITVGQGIVLLGTALGAALLLFLLWRVVLGRVHRLFDRLGRLVPVDVTRYSSVTSGLLFLVVGAVVLGVAAMVMISTLGVDVSGPLWAAAQGVGAVARSALPKAVRLLLYFMAAGLGAQAVQKLVPPMVKQAVSRRAGDDTLAEEVEKRANTLQAVFVKSLQVLLWVSVTFLVLAELGVNIAPLLAGASVVAIAVGFGAQTLVRDLLAGVFVLMEDQYRIGDVVAIGGVSGMVEGFNLRRTTLRDLDGLVHFVPNGEIRVASNFTKEKSRVNLNISVAYRTDLDHAFAVLNRVGAELSQDPALGPLITDQVKVVRVADFAESAIVIKLVGETLPRRQWEVAGELRRRIKRAFDQEGIEMPFPHRTVYWGFQEETRVRRVPSEADRERPAGGGAVAEGSEKDVG